MHMSVTKLGYFLANLSHVNLLIRPAEITQESRGMFLPPLQPGAVLRILHE